MIRKEACPFYRTISGVPLCWELEEPLGPQKDLKDYDGFSAELDPVSAYVLDLTLLTATDTSR